MDFYCLSVRQPWVHAIFHLGKDIENRGSRYSHRGLLLIHAAKQFGPAEQEDLDTIREILREPTDIGTKTKVPPVKPNALSRTYPYETGKVIGYVTITDCVRSSKSPWFFGPYGLVLKDPKLLSCPFELRGQLGMFKVTRAHIPVVSRWW